VFVQWCVKGLALDDDAAARAVIEDGTGIVCNWWRTVGTISPRESRQKLTVSNLDRHVNHFSEPDPASGRPFNEMTPFVSLSAGTVERDRVAQTNLVHRARKTALWFAMDFGRRPTGYLYPCWLLLAPRQSVEVEGIAEEIRDLNTYRRYSHFQTEGEITAKILVPDNHVQCCEKWTLTPDGRCFRREWVYANPRFTLPERLTNVRELI
jgi:hypothetical protein